MENQIFYEAFSQLQYYEFKACPTKNAGKNQRKFITEVNSKIPNILLPSDTLYEFYEIDYKSILSDLTIESYGSWGFNEVYWNKNKNPSKEQLLDRCVNDIYSHIWHYTAKKINPDKHRSILGSEGYFYFEKKKIITAPIQLL